MPPAEPPAGRRPGDPRAQGDAPPRADRPMSRDDLFGPSGPFGVSGTPATPRGAGTSGFEPPEDADRPRAAGAEPRGLRAEDEPTRALPPAEDEPTRAYRPGYRPEYRPDAEATRAYPAQPPAAPPPPAAAAAPSPTAPTAPSLPSDDATRVYEPGADYRPGQYQPRSMSGGYQRTEFEQSAYTPGQYQSGFSSQETMGYPSDAAGGAGWAQGGGPDGSTDPGRRRPWLVGAAVGVLVVAIAAGGAYALFGREDGTPSSAGPAPTPRASATGGDTTEPAASQGTEPSQEPSESATPGAAAGEPIPDEPWTEKGLDFGFVTKVSRRGDEIRLTFNRATFYYGDEATEKNGGTPPDNDYLIEDTNKKVRTFVLAVDAPLEGSTQLGGTRGGSEGIPITEDELVANMRSVVGDNPQGVPVWLRHEDGKKDGPVTALAEQFIP
jgi:hypothetical protein